MASVFALPELSVLSVSGAERTQFLQGQLTQDVALARPDATIMAGWCDPRGRLLWIGHLFAGSHHPEGDYGLIVPRDRAEELATGLRRFLFRTKAKVELPDLHVQGILSETETAGPNAPSLQELRVLGVPGRRFVVSREPLQTAHPEVAWSLADIRDGIPVIQSTTVAEFVPQMVNLDLLGGISFTKGCYTGQEIIARTRYLGRVKRRMLRFGASAAAPLPGADVYGQRGVVGHVVASGAAPGGSELLAVIVLDDLPGPFHLDSAHTQPLNQLELPYAVPELVS